MDHCETHGQRHASGTCRTCMQEYCEAFLVYAFGRAKRPYCMRCALVAAGTTPSDAWLAEVGITV